MKVKFKENCIFIAEKRRRELLAKDCDFCNYGFFNYLHVSMKDIEFEICIRCFKKYFKRKVKNDKS